MRVEAAERRGVRPRRHARLDQPGDQFELRAELRGTARGRALRALLIVLVLLLVTAPHRLPQYLRRVLQILHRLRRPRLPVPLPRTRFAQRRVRRTQRTARQRQPAQRQRCRGRGLTGEQRRQGRLDGDCPQRVRTSRIQPAAEPSSRYGRLRRRRLPDRHRPEVTAIGLRIADAPHDREPLAVPQPLQALHPRVQPEPVAEVEHLVALVRQVRPSLLVRRVRRRDDCVEPVVPAVQRDHDQHRLIARQRIVDRRGHEVGPVHLGRTGSQRARRGHPAERQEPSSRQIVHNSPIRSRRTRVRTPQPRSAALDP